MIPPGVEHLPKFTTLRATIRRRILPFGRTTVMICSRATVPSQRGVDARATVSDWSASGATVIAPFAKSAMIEKSQKDEVGNSENAVFS